MAVAGDVIIKLAADFADFSKGMAESTQRLEQFAAQTVNTSRELEKLFGLVKSGIQALSIEEAARALINYVDGLQKSAAALDTLAQTYGLTTDALQAYQYAALQSGQHTDAITDIFRRFNVALGEAQQGGKAQIDVLNRLGVTILDINGKAKTNTEVFTAFAQALLKLPEGAQRAQAEMVLLGKSGQDANVILEKIANNSLPQLIDAATKAGVVLGEDDVKAMAKFETQAEILGRQIDVLASKLYIPIKRSFVDEAAIEVTRLSNALQALGAYDSVMDKLLLVFGGKGSLTGPNATTDMYSRDIEKLNVELPKLNQQLEDLQKNTAIPAGPREQLISNLQERITAAENQRDYLSAVVANRAMPPVVVEAPKPTPGSNPPVAGSGKEAEDIEAQIRRYQVLADAARKAQDTISAGNAQNIEDLKRQVTVQQQVDDIVGKLAAKHITITDDQHKRLTQAVTDAETQRAAEQKLLDVNVAAVETDKKYGDGKVALTKLHKDLADQLKTNRINQDDYNRATKEGTEAIQQSALAAQRYDDNLGSLAAGFEHAANAYARSNDLFSTGEQAFNALTNSMMEGLQALEGQSTKTFGQILADFANMLAQMALKAAVSQVFQTIFGAVAPGASVGFASVAGINSANLAAGLPAIPGLQHGGPVSAGRPYVVGESGPELFVPSAAGSIVPGGVGGVTHNGDVVVNVGLGTTQGATDPATAMAFGRRMQAAIKDVIQNEKRPGGSLYQRLSA
jgi:hypothetical protein